MDRDEEIANSWGREMQKGHTKLAALMFLNREPMTGYEVMKEVEEKTLGFWKLTSGGIYPVLKELEDKGYIRGKWKSEGERKKKVYRITQKGKKLLETALKKQQQMAEKIGGLFRQFAHEILETELPPPPKILDFFPFGKCLEDKPVKKRMQTLKSIRNRLQDAIKIVDKRLDKLRRLQKKNEKG